MVLFFIITLVAAYMSRNLLFEQRTSTNQFRSTLAFETAEAGVEWALARLNDARMNDDCTPLTSAASVTTEVTFRERYLDINSTTGVISPVAGGRIAGCVFNGTTWVCDCPASGNPIPR
ncbi:MAG: pilus assembly PilX N-terminal domain-containing protein [Betaproteobacteria bacterium]|nr:pilus assembly PilX N-terminal domain-containing protein [Betaproteobacteria bacterium]